MVTWVVFKTKKPNFLQARLLIYKIITIGLINLI